MSNIFRDFFVKEKPVFTGITRGIGGFGFGAAGGGASGSASNKIAASGGVIADYEDGGTKYRAHIFANSGALTISSADADATIEYLVVGGGGGGGYTGQAQTAGAGGGAGGLRTNVPGVQNAGGTSLTAAAYPVSAGTYTVVVGDGGPAGTVSGTKGETGTDSAFYPPSHSSYPAVQYIRGAGGGGGGNAGPGNSTPVASGRDGNAGGGSGGGTTFYTDPTADHPGGAAGTADPNHPKPAGNAGGAGPPGGSNSSTSGGGGGAGAAGGAGRAPAPGNIPSSDIAFGRGGIGVQVAIAGPSTASPIGTPGPSGTGWFAGGGGSGSYKNPPSNEGNGSAPLAGGGSSGYQGTGSGNAPKSPGAPALKAYGQQMTGGGGGGGGTSNPGSERNGSPGQPGIVIVRYELPQNNAADEAKATGGAVSKVGSKIVHVFHHPGSLVVPATIPSVEYFLVGGGGGGAGADGGGGGGGGGIQTNIPSIIPAPATGSSMSLPATTYAIQVGRGGGQSGATPGSGPYDVGNDGEATTFNSITGGGGGRGGFGGPSPVVPSPFMNGGAGSNGSSGGGGGSNGPSGGSGGDGQGATGYDGANAGPLPSWAGAGGGGAGGNAPGINGGDGIQLPTTYHDPSIMTVGGPGPSSSYGWFAGGGGGGAADPGSEGSGGIGGGGRGEDTDDPYALNEINGMRGTGGGGGGGDSNHLSTRTGGMGGPGIVIIAYDA